MRHSFSLLKILSICSASVLLFSGMVHLCAAAEIGVRKAEKIEAGKVIKRSIRPIHRTQKSVTVKPPPLRLEPEEYIEYEVEAAEPVPIRRAYKAVPAVSCAIPASITKEDVLFYVEDLKYGETIDEVECAAQVLGSRSVRRYINDPVMDNVYNALINAFREYDDELLLRKIVESLGKLGNDEAGSIIVSYLSNGDYHSVKSVIIRALGSLQYSGAVHHLVRILQSNSHRDLRMHSATSLGKIGDNAAVYPLISALNDKDRDIRKAAIGALGVLGPQEAKSPLTSILNYDDDLELREEAARALRRIEDSRN
jgi:hypothetical protein